MKSLRKALEITAIVACVFILISTCAALAYVNLRVIFTVDAWAVEHRRSAEAAEVERARADYVLDRIERHLVKLDGKHGRPIGAKK